MKDLNTNLLRPNQVQVLEGERNLIQRSTGQTAGDGTIPGYQGGGGEARARLQAIDKMLAVGAPVPLNPMEKDNLHKMEKELRDDITHGMLSAEEMRKCPATAVDRHMRWEEANINKIMRWKNARLQLAGKDGGEDEANLEQYRPESSGHRIMTDGVIPGLHTMSQQAKDNWPLGDPKCETAIGQVKKRKEMSPEAKQAARERALAASAKAVAMRAQAKLLAEGVVSHE